MNEYDPVVLLLLDQLCVDAEPLQLTEGGSRSCSRLREVEVDHVICVLVVHEGYHPLLHLWKVGQVGPFGNRPAVTVFCGCFDTLRTIENLTDCSGKAQGSKVGCTPFVSLSKYRKIIANTQSEGTMDVVGDWLKMPPSNGAMNWANERKTLG